jgi:hypothetical protein
MVHISSSNRTEGAIKDLRELKITHIKNIDLFLKLFSSVMPTFFSKNPESYHQVLAIRAW